MEGFQRFIGLIPRAFRVDAHMQSHFQCLFHGGEAFAAAGLAFPVDQYASRAVEDAEDGDLCHFDLGDGLVAAGDARVGNGDVDQRIVVAADDKGLAFCEFFAAADA